MRTCVYQGVRFAVFFGKFSVCTKWMIPFSNVFDTTSKILLIVTLEVHVLQVSKGVICSSSPGWILWKFRKTLRRTALMQSFFSKVTCLGMLGNFPKRSFRKIFNGKFFYRTPPDYCFWSFMLICSFSQKMFPKSLIIKKVHLQKVTLFGVYCTKTFRTKTKQSI